MLYEPVHFAVWQLPLLPLLPLFAIVTIVVIICHCLTLLSSYAIVTIVVIICLTITFLSSDLSNSASRQLQKGFPHHLLPAPPAPLRQLHSCRLLHLPQGGLH